MVQIVAESTARTADPAIFSTVSAPYRSGIHCGVASGASSRQARFGYSIAYIDGTQSPEFRIPLTDLRTR
jgi:hypothetical protein